MFQALLLLAIGIICVGSAGVPGVPVIIDVPLNRTAFPNGYASSTSLAPSWEFVPVDQVGFTVPTNALSVTIRLQLPRDIYNSWVNYDYSTMFPLCQLGGELGSSGNTCGGFTGLNSIRTQTFRNFTVSAAGFLLDDGTSGGSGFRWRTGVKHYFGITANSNDRATSLYPIYYNITSIEIATCAAGTIGGLILPANTPACVPLQQVAAVPYNFNYNGNVGGGVTGLVFAVEIPVNVGLMTVTFTVPTGSTGQGFNPTVLGSAMGFPGTNLDCPDNSAEQISGSNTVTTWTCPVPSSGIFNIWFRSGEAENFAGSMNIQFQSCSATTAGPACGYTLTDLGDLPAPSTTTTSTLTIAAGAYHQFRLNIPAGSNYGFNMTLVSDAALTITHRPNGYASNDTRSGYPNANHLINLIANQPDMFVFQFQDNLIGEIAYFAVSAPTGASTLNITISTTAIFVPPTSSTTSSSSSSTSSASTSSSRSSTSQSRSSATSNGSSGSSSSASNSRTTSSTQSSPTTTSSPSDANTLIACAAIAIGSALLL